MLSATVAICTYNRYDLLKTCVESVLAQNVGERRFDVVIVDNSPDGALAAAKQREFGAAHPQRLRYIVEATPGLSNARNVATRTSDADVIVFIDDDAIAEAGWLSHVMEGFEEYGDLAGVVGGRIDPIWEAPRPPWLGDQILGYVSVVNWGGGLRVAADNEWFAGANIAYRRKTLHDLGGFSTNLGRIGAGSSLLSNEENAVNDAMTGAGYRMIYAPEARVSHLVESKRLTREWFRQRTAWQAVSDMLARPATTMAKKSRHMRSVFDYLDHLPPRDRPMAGLYADTDDPEMFQRQLDAVYGLTVAALTGYQDAPTP